MQLKKIVLFLTIFYFFIFGQAHALESHVLENGLEIFIEENHIVPLATLRITFRAGAIVETKELNGL